MEKRHYLIENKSIEDELKLNIEQSNNRFYIYHVDKVSIQQEMLKFD